MSIQSKGRLWLSGDAAEEQDPTTEDREGDVPTGLNLIWELYFALCAIIARLLTHLVVIHFPVKFLLDL